MSARHKISTALTTLAGKQHVAARSRGVNEQCRSQIAIAMLRTSGGAGTKSSTNIWYNHIWLSAQRNMGHKARIGNHLTNLRQSLLDKQHEEAMPRKMKQKSKKRHRGEEEEEGEGGGRANEHAGTMSHDDDNILKRFDAGFHDIMEEGGKPPNSMAVVESLLPNTSQLKGQMANVVNHLEKSLRLVRGGEPTPDMFDNIVVFAYGGAATPLPTVAQVLLVSPSLAKVTCYDPTNTVATRDAIRDSGMNFNPQIDSDNEGDGVILVPLPKISAETRKLLAKQVAHMGESTKTKIRHLRRNAHDIVKKGQLGKLEGVSKDDAFRVGKEVEAITEEAIATVQTMIDKKQQHVMAT
jgi:ribosome recycling factor